VKKNLITVAAGTAFLLTMTSILAVPFNSFDPRSMAMGGAGVAVASPGSAPFFNPALLSVTDAREDFAIELPILGGRVSDPDEFADAIDDFDDTLMDQVDAAINSYNATPGNSTAVINAVNALNAEIQSLDDKPLQFEIGGGLVVGIPSESFGMAFSAAGSVYFSGVFNYEDAGTVSDLTQDLTSLDACYAGAPANFASCLVAANFNYVDINTDPNNPTVEFIAQSDTGAQSDVKSKARFVAIAMGEVGLSFSREMSLFGTEVALGMTPKMVSVSVFDYEANADSADTDDFDGDNYSADYSDFNLDVGIARDHGNGWRSGFVIKNIISQDYDAMNTDPLTGIETPTGTVVSLNPQARAGVSHSTDWSTVALDIDLTENDALDGVGDKSRYVAIGAELNALDWAQIRLGYRADTVNSDRSVVSAGIGFSPLGMHFDLAVAGNADEIGAALQFGFRF